MLGNLHDRMIECFSKLESNHTKLQSSVDSLSSELTEVKEQSHVEMKKIGQWVDAAHRQQAKAIGRVFEKVSKLESRIGVGKDRRMEGDAASVAGSSSGSTGSSVESNTVLERIKNVEYVMLELLEKANDPDAASEFCWPVLLRVSERSGNFLWKIRASHRPA